MTCIYWKNGEPVITESWSTTSVAKNERFYVYDLSGSLMPTGELSESTITAGRARWNHCPIDSFPPEFRAWLLVNNYT